MADDANKLSALKFKIDTLEYWRCICLVGFTETLDL
jgi:hypothetical protein